MTRRRMALLVSALVVLCVMGGCTTYIVLSWPRVGRLAHENPRTTAFIERYGAERRAEGKSDAVAWGWVPASQISPNLKRAVVCGEDLEFFHHHGFSTAEMKAAVEQAIEERRAPRGASTITQQLAKNLWLSPSRNPIRKLEEAVLTYQLERNLTKQRILELYLNVVEFGDGIYGAEAAAERYFGIRASALTEHQAAMLAASLPRPSSWHPGSESRAYAAYVAEIERRMARATFLWRYVGGAPPADTAATSDSAPR